MLAIGCGVQEISVPIGEDSGQKHEITSARRDLVGSRELKENRMMCSVPA